MDSPSLPGKGPGDRPKPHHTWHYPCGFGLSGDRSSNPPPAAATPSLYHSFLALYPLCGTRWCPVLPTARANADVSATSSSQRRTGRRYGVAGRDSFGDCRRLCRGADLGTVATRARALARYERWSLPAGRTTTGTSDLEHLLAWPHHQRSPRRSSRSQPRSPLIPASPPPAPPFPRAETFAKGVYRFLGLVATGPAMATLPLAALAGVGKREVAGWIGYGLPPAMSPCVSAICDCHDFYDSLVVYYSVPDAEAPKLGLPSASNLTF